MGGGEISPRFLTRRRSTSSSSVWPPFSLGTASLIARRHRHVPLELHSIDRFEDGVVQLHYRVQSNLDDAASHGPLALFRFRRSRYRWRPPLSGQARTSAPTKSSGTGSGACASADSLVLEVHLDGKAVYSSAFAICQSRRSEIQPEPQQESSSSV